VTYIEVWPPDESYDDLRRLIAEAKRLGANKPVILAAYLSPFLGCQPEDLPGAEAAALLATAAIAASGGAHLLLGERDGILCDPYYPKYATLRPEFAPRLRAYYDLVVRYEEWLVAPEVADWEVEAVALSGTPIGQHAAAGQVWAIGRQRPGYRMINLVNLRGQSTAEWNALRTPPTTARDLELVVDGLPPIRRALTLTPDAGHGRATPVEFGQDGVHVRVWLPSLTIWTLVLFEL
jgi:dextranase